MLVRTQLTLFIFLKDFYLFMRDTERGRGTGRGRSRLHAGSPDVGLDPGTPGSCLGPKAGTKPLSHPGCPDSVNFSREMTALDPSFTLRKI